MSLFDDKTDTYFKEVTTLNRHLVQHPENQVSMNDEMHSKFDSTK